MTLHVILISFEQSVAYVKIMAHAKQEKIGSWPSYSDQIMKGALNTIYRRYPGYDDCYIDFSARDLVFVSYQFMKPSIKKWRKTCFKS